VRNTFIALMVAWPAVYILKTMIDIGAISDVVDAYAGSVTLIWMGLALVFGVAWLLAHRQKRCRACGHEWANTPSPE
jgi:hypothetical protein